MKKKLFICIGILSLGLLWGYNSSRKEGLGSDVLVDLENQEVNIMGEPLITKEYLLEHCDVTEDELKDIDVEAFIKEFQLTERNANDYKISFLIEIFLEGDEDGEMAPYAYLSEADYENQLIKEREIENVKVIGFYIARGTYQETVILDIAQDKAYWGKEKNLIEYWNADVVAVTLNGDKKQTVELLLKENQIVEWKRYYEGTSEGTTGSFGWSLFFELEDGTIYKYSGHGVQGESKPAQWNAFEVGLKGLFEE